MVISMGKVSDIKDNPIRQNSQLLTDYSIDLYTKGMIDGAKVVCLMIAITMIIGKWHKCHYIRRTES